MSPITARLSQLRLYLDHLQSIQRRGVSVPDLEGDLALRNDVLHSLQVVCQVVIDVASEMLARRGEAFADYTDAIRRLGRDPRFPSELISELAGLAGFRNVIVHEYVAVDLSRAILALNRLDLLERFLRIASGIAEDDGG